MPDIYFKVSVMLIITALSVGINPIFMLPSKVISLENLNMYDDTIIYLMKIFAKLTALLEFLILQNFHGKNFLILAYEIYFTTKIKHKPKLFI